MSTVIIFTFISNCISQVQFLLSLKYYLKQQRRAFQKTNRTKSAREKTEDVFQINLYIFFKK